MGLKIYLLSLTGQPVIDKPLPRTTPALGLDTRPIETPKIKASLQNLHSDSLSHFKGNMYSQ